MVQLGSVDPAALAGGRYPSFFLTHGPHSASCHAVRCRGRQGDARRAAPGVPRRLSHSCPVAFSTAQRRPVPRLPRPSARRCAPSTDGVPSGPRPASAGPGLAAPPLRTPLSSLTETVHKPDLIPSKPQVISAGLPCCRKQRSSLLSSYHAPAWRIIASAQAWSSGARGGIQGAA